MEFKKKSLTLEVGNTYIFNHSSAHPLRFSTTSDGTHGSGAEYVTGVQKSGGVTTIDVTSSTPDLYYYCSAHPGMGADITIAAG
jgi:plastocyanin